MRQGSGSGARPAKPGSPLTTTVSSSYGNYRVEVKIEATEEDIDRAINLASAAIDKALKNRQIKQIREIKVRDRLEAKRRKHREYMQRWRKPPVKPLVYHNDNGVFHSDGGDYVFGQKVKEV